MSWFNKKKQEERIKIANTASLEIAVAKKLTDKASEQAIKDANQLRELLERNHFSVTLYIAVGGRKPMQTNRKNHA